MRWCCSSCGSKPPLAAASDAAEPARDDSTRATFSLMQQLSLVGVEEAMEVLRLKGDSTFDGSGSTGVQMPHKPPSEAAVHAPGI